MPTDAMIDVAELIAALSRPEAYPHVVGDVEVHQTHISVVFLAGEFAYKIKKPVNLGFVDFSTLEKRRHFCEEEVRLNRRLAPHVYLGVIAITEPEAQAREAPTSLACASGSMRTLRVNGAGPIVEYAVQMKRLPSAATLECRLLRNEASAAQVRAIAQRLAAFHRHADSSPHISSFGRFDVVARNTRENFEQTEAHVGHLVSPDVYGRVRELMEACLAQLRERIEARVARGVPRDTHGDLHLDHVYLFPGEPPPGDLVIIDCIEFADRFRYADPVADMAFLAMDLTFHGRRDLADVFADAYFQASGDRDGRALLPCYSAYRALVRAKVEGMELSDKEIDASERVAAETRARAHWLLALGELERPSRRPAVLVIAGLPGSGKSTLAQALADRANFTVLRSDVIRKQLAADYSDAGTARTYAGMLRRAEDELWHGRRVLLDANFRDDRQRLPFLHLAQRWAVPFLFIHCTTSAAIARARLGARHHDASDADWSVYQQLANTWQPLSEPIRRVTFALDTSGPFEQNLETVLDHLRAHVFAA